MRSTSGSSSDSHELSDASKQSRVTLRYCRFCRVIKPDRAHHCRQCGTCVLMRGECDAHTIYGTDHIWKFHRGRSPLPVGSGKWWRCGGLRWSHSARIGTLQSCIGFNNYKQFLLLLTYMTATLIVSSLIILVYAPLDAFSVIERDPYALSAWRRALPVVIAAASLVYALLAPSVMLWRWIPSALQNHLAIEYSRMTIVVGLGVGTHRCVRSAWRCSHPYDSGSWRRNLIAMLGAPSAWLLPCVRPGRKCSGNRRAVLPDVLPHQCTSST